MTRHNQLRLIYHGSLFMVLSMIVGFPELWIAFHRALDEPVRQALRQSHAIFMATGIWMIATAAALPLLAHTGRSISIIAWSLVISGYTFIAALAVLYVGYLLNPAAAKISIQQDQLMALPYHLGWINIGLIAFSGLTSFVPGVLILLGACKAARHSPLDAIQ